MAKLIFIIFFTLYLIGYGVVRKMHFLVNWDGCRGYHGIRSFDMTGPGPSPQAMLIAGISYWVYWPLHKGETLIRHGPVIAFSA